MSATEYNEDRGDDSDRAHELARRKFYPGVFRVPFERLFFENTLLKNQNSRDAALDADLAIDRVVKISVLGGGDYEPKLPVPITVQERFRKPEYAHRRDATITEWNHSSGLPAELYKMAANLFVYGYHNDDFSDFVECIAFWVGPVLLAISDNKIDFEYVENNGKNQSFLGVPFGEIYKTGAVLYHYPPNRADEFGYEAALASGVALHRVAVRRKAIRGAIDSIKSWVDVVVPKDEK